jgi:hypothetical protein
MSLRLLVVMLGLYIALDLANPLMPGAFTFDADDSVEGVAGSSVRLYPAPAPALMPLPAPATAAAHMVLPASPLSPHVARTVGRVVPRRRPPSVRDTAPPSEDH